MVRTTGVVAALVASFYVRAESSGFSTADICTAAIATETGRELKIIKTLTSGDMPAVGYTRHDGDKFRYRCRVEGNRVVWQAYFPDRSAWGRWRNSSDDAVLTFQADSEKLSISSSMTGITDTYRKKAFGKR